MIPAEEFRRHAAECKHMAAFAPDPQSRATWNQMAQRWLQCAEWAQRYTPPLSSDKAKANRQAARVSH